MTKKDINGLKGAIRRTFVRSDLRKQVQANARVEHLDPTKPRVEHWVYCNVCGEIVPRWTTDVDHIEPVIPITTHFEDMPLAQAVDRMWCSIENLQIICTPCHDKKTSLESEARKPYRKPRKGKKNQNEQSQRTKKAASKRRKRVVIRRTRRHSPC